MNIRTETIASRMAEGWDDKCEVVEQVSVAMPTGYPLSVADCAYEVLLHSTATLTP